MTVAPDDWREHRPTPSQRLHEVTMAALTRVPSPPESAVEITRNAKGDFQFTVTVRGTDAQDCYEEAVRLAAYLTDRYPRDVSAPDGDDDAGKAARKAAAIAAASVKR